MTERGSPFVDPLFSEKPDPQQRQEFFGVDRLDLVVENCALQAQGLLDNLIQSVEEFSGGRPADDDRTIIVARVTPGS